MERTVDIREVIGAVRAAKPLILDENRRSRVTAKGIGDFVTQVDLSVQEYLRSFLGEKYPEIQFMGEEQSGQATDASRPSWILDPIDGTSNLIFGLRHSAVSLGLYDGKELSFGVVYDPYREEVFHAVRGEGAFLNGERIRVRQARGPEDCLISFGTNPYSRNSRKEFFLLLEQIQARCVDLRRFGSAALDLAYVACGRSGGFLELNLKPWDFAAGILLIREAGGCVSDFRGRPVSPLYPADILCGTPEVYRGLLEMSIPFCERINCTEQP